MDDSKRFFVNKDTLQERTGQQLMDIAINHLEVAIVDVIPVPDTVEDFMNNEVKHVFIIQGTSVNGDKIEMMLSDTQVEHVGRAASVYVLEETRRKMDELGLPMNPDDDIDDAIGKVIKSIIELMEGLDDA